MTRILIVDDEAVWTSALAEMYGEIFGSEADITAVFSSESAVKLLGHGRFDVLSCDINLSSGSERRPGSPDGRTVLRSAAERRAAVCAIVPTGVASDAHLSVAIPKNTESARLTLTAYLNELFPARSMRLEKSYGLSPQEITAIWAKDCAMAIRELSRSWPRVRPPYELTISGTLTQPSVTIRGVNRLFSSISNPMDAECLLHLAANSTAGTATPDAQVIRIYGSEHNDARAARRQATIALEALAMSLSKEGVDPDRLFERERAEGWRLTPDVVVSGIDSDRLFGKHDWL